MAHAGGPGRAPEGDEQIRLAVVEHALVADGAGRLAEGAQVGAIGLDGGRSNGVLQRARVLAPLAQPSIVRAVLLCF